MNLFLQLIVFLLRHLHLENTLPCCVPFYFKKSESLKIAFVKLVETLLPFWGQTKGDEYWFCWLNVMVFVWMSLFRVSAVSRGCVDRLHDAGGKGWGWRECGHPQSQTHSKPTVPETFPGMMGRGGGSFYFIGLTVFDTVTIVKYICIYAFMHLADACIPIDLQKSAIQNVKIQNV